MKADEEAVDVDSDVALQSLGPTAAGTCRSEQVVSEFGWTVTTDDAQEWRK